MSHVVATIKSVVEKARIVIAVLALLLIAALARGALVVFATAPGQHPVKPAPADVSLPAVAPTRTLFLPIVVAPQVQRLASLGVEMSPIALEGGLNAVAQAGTAWVRRATLWWPDIEPQQGQRNWASIRYLETEFANAAARNMQVVLVVRGTPSWAQQYPGYSCGPIRPDKLSAFADFVVALVGRYSGAPYHVRYWEMWNEPDIDRHLVAPDSLWGCWGDDTDEYYGGGYYAQMLKAVYPRVKAVDAQAQVMVGGLLLDCDPRPSPTSLSIGGGCIDEAHRRPARFLEGILRGGGGLYFDGVAFHAYDYFNGSEGGYVNGNFRSSAGRMGPVSIAKAGFIRETLGAYAVGGKFVMNDESALLCQNCDGQPIFELTKAYYVAQVYAAAGALDLRANIWYRLFGWPGWSSALLDTDLSPRLAYTAYKTVAAVLSGASYVGVITSADVGGALNVRGYKFAGAGRRVWVVWAADAAAHTLTLAQPPQTALDVYGAPFVQADPLTINLAPRGQLLAYLEWAEGGSD
jgi:hypothetical protein